MARKTKLMQRVETSYAEALETLIPRMVNQSNLSTTADDFGVSKATLGYWMLKLGIQMRKLAVSPGEHVELTRQVRH